MVYGPDRAAQTDGELNQTSQWAATAPCASWKGEGKGAMWGMWGKCREWQPIWGICMSGRGTCGQFAHEGFA